MRSLCVLVILTFGIGMTACTRANSDSRATARQAGRDAYHASETAKREAQKAAKEVEKAGKDFRQGWEQAKHDNTGPRGK